MPELWLPMPADIMAVKQKEEETLHPSCLLELGSEEGVLWPGEGSPLPMLIQRAERLKGTKTSRPGFPFWPLEEAVHWSLDPQPVTRDLKKSIRPEYRVHVGIDDATWTAEPEALFSSAGVRYGSGYGLAAEIRDGRGGTDGSGPRPEDPPHLLILGAESRAVSCTALAGGCFPFFEAFRRSYEERIDQLEKTGHPLGLRLQLLTPGSFGSWQPAWPAALKKKLLAVCMDRYVPVSGWDLQAGGPRSVRRLVPAGTVYLLGSFEAEEVLRLCSDWWGKSLCEENQGGEAASFLAPPFHDGYGLVLPTPFGLPPRSPKS